MPQPAVVWVSEEVPDCNLGGGSIRQGYLLTELARRVPVGLVLAGQLRDPSLRESLASVVEIDAPGRWTRGKFERRVNDLVMASVGGPKEVYDTRVTRTAIRRAVGPWLQQADLVVANQQTTFSLLPKSRRGRWVADFHHVAAEMSRQERPSVVGGRQRWVNGRNITHAERFERWVVDNYDLLGVVCEEDRVLLDAPLEKVHIAPNGVDLSRYTVTPVPASLKILLPATLNYLPNVQGAEWFCDNVLEKVRADVPGAELDIVGRSPTADVLALGNRPGVAVHGDVESMVPWFRQARVVIVPLLIGTGTRLKAVESMAAGRPLVGTTIGLGGLGLTDGVDAVITDDPDRMARDIVSLLGDDQRAAALAAAGRKRAEELYDWKAIAGGFADRVLGLL